jgi:steroid delta-isomerase-like uncharacterized protein
MSTRTESNKALVRRIYDEMWNKGEPAAARQLFTGPQGVEKFVVEFLQAFPDLQHTVEEMVAEDERVVVRFTARGTHKGTWKGLAPSGKAVRYSGITLAEIEGEKIIRHQTCWDALDVSEQIEG